MEKLRRTRGRSIMAIKFLCGANIRVFTLFLSIYLVVLMNSIISCCNIDLFLDTKVQQMLLDAKNHVWFLASISIRTVIHHLFFENKYLYIRMCLIKIVEKSLQTLLIFIRILKRDEWFDEIFYCQIILF